LSKRISQSRVIPLLIDLPASDLKGPLVQFQAATTSEEDMHKLVTAINNSLNESKLRDSQINKAFDKWWPDLGQELKLAIQMTKGNEAVEEKRPEREILEEVLGVVRSLARSISKVEEASVV